MFGEMADGERERLRAAAAVLLKLADTPAGAVADAGKLLEVTQQVELALCRQVQQVDRSGQFTADGSPSATSWLRAQSNSSPGLAQRRVRIGRALAGCLPETADAWASGCLTFEHADVIALAVRNHSAEHVAVLDHELSILAATVSPLELSRLAERFRIQLDPDDAAERAKRQRRDQKLHLSPTFGGNWVLSATLDPEAGATVKAALDAFTPPPDPNAAGLTETAAFRRSQAITEICRQALDTGQGRTTGGEKPHIIVTVDDETLRTGIGSGTLQDGTPIPSAAVRRLACDSKLIPVLYGTQSQPLDIGRAQRTVPAWLRKAVILRDKHCRFKGCDRPAEWADCHHAVHWRDGGPTALHNLVLLCRFHHHLCHEGGWTITVHHDPNSTTDFTFHPPDLAGRPRAPGLGPPGREQAA